ncbi:MAG: GNAT family N-acetyltransferase, partial [Bacteroidota bacterium]
MIQFDITKSITQLNAIIELQKRNLKLNLDSTEIQSQGFVTVQHDLSILEEMHEASPHIIALNDSDVVGYALV